MDNASIILFVLFKPCPPSGNRMLVFRLLMTCIMRFGHGCVGVRWLLPSLLFACLCFTPGTLSRRWQRRVPTLPEVLCHLQWVGNWGMWALQLLLKSFEPKWRAASLRDPHALLAWQYCPSSCASWGDLSRLTCFLPMFDKKTASLASVREEHQARWFSLSHFIRVQLVASWPQPLQTGSREASERLACKDHHGAGEDSRLCFSSKSSIFVPGGSFCCCG